MDKIKDAALKAEKLMDSKYGCAWKIINISETGEEKIEIKPEYFSEYDNYYEKFFFS